jgi:hypothetical protein
MVKENQAVFLSPSPIPYFSDFLELFPRLVRIRSDRQAASQTENKDGNALNPE